MRRKSGRLLCFAARTVLVAAALAVAPAVACAQQYPSMDIRLICAFPAGSGADVLVRYFAEKLRPIAGRTIIVENKTGAMGNIATEYVARARPDGHTVYVHAGSGVAANMHLFKKPPVDAAKAIRIAATINRQPYMLVVAAKSPIKTVSELTAAMKVKKEKASYATTNPITTVMGRLYKEIAGVQAVEVTYRTAPDSLNDITSGAVDYAVLDPVFSLSQQRAGRLRILAVSSGARLAANPDLPVWKPSILERYYSKGLLASDLARRTFVMPDLIR